MTVMVHNLGKMTSIGLLKPFSDAKKLVLRKLKDETALKRSRIHALAVLVAQKIYAQVTSSFMRRLRGNTFAASPKSLWEVSGTSGFCPMAGPLLWVAPENLSCFGACNRASN